MIEIPEEEKLHSIYIERFAKEMILKMDYKANAFGWDGWDKMDSHTILYYFNKSIEKGDPIDIANYCMMLWRLNLNAEKFDEANESAD